MDKQINLFEEKFNAILTYAPLGLAEIDKYGTILTLSLVGRDLLGPLFEIYKVNSDNLYPILDCILPGISEQIQSYTPERGQILNNHLNIFRLPPPNNETEKYYQFNVTKMFEDCIIVAFEDLTSKYLEEKAMHQADLDKALAQGKFEIASEVLHDIGNAVVGFGSYLNRTNRFLDQDNIKNLQNVSLFLKNQQTALTEAFGEQKAQALVNLMEGIAQTQKDSREEIRKSIDEQLNIISHIQEILAIQRHYVSGHPARERKPVNIKDIIQDCQSMLFASYDKKGIKITFDIPEQIPMIKGDRTKLMQVMLNILKNSIEAIDTDLLKKEITISLLQNDKTLQLTITDTGKGFDKTTASRLFERGYTTKNTGTGLGLYNCKSIIESHAGHIDIYSEGLGLGTTTSIKFTN